MRPQSPVPHPATAGEDVLPLCELHHRQELLRTPADSSQARVRPSPPSEQGSQPQHERLETSGSGPGNRVPHPVVEGEWTSPHFEQHHRQEVHRTPAGSSQACRAPKAPSGQTCSLHDGHPETQDSGPESPMRHPVTSAEKTLPCCGHHCSPGAASTPADASPAWIPSRSRAGRWLTLCCPNGFIFFLRCLLRNGFEIHWIDVSLANASHLLLSDGGGKEKYRSQDLQARCRPQ